MKHQFPQERVMALPASFDESNLVLSKPASMSHEECTALSVCYRPAEEGGHPDVVSCWKLTREELDEINRTGRVWLIVTGNTMPPACVLGISPFST